MLSATADVAYKASSYYSPGEERGIAWNDPTIGIAWPVADPILSPRDQQHPALPEIARDFFWSPDEAEQRQPA